jgi:hypothetical protein
LALKALILVHEGGVVLVIYTASKRAKSGLPYVVMTFADLPAEDPHQLHWYLKERLCSKFGWGMYYFARNHYWGESPGWKLVAKIRLSQEAIGLFRTDTSHPVFPAAVPPRTAYWERTPDPPRFVRVGAIKRSKQGPPSTLRLMAKLQAGRLPQRIKSRGHGMEFIRNVLSKDLEEKKGMGF